MCIGFNIYCIYTHWHSLQSLTVFAQSYGSLLHLNPNFLRLFSVKAEPPPTPWVCAPGQQQPAGLQNYFDCSGSEWLPCKCSEPVDSPAAWNKSIELQSWYRPLLGPLRYCAFRSFCLSSPSRMLMGSWLCRSSRRAQRQTPLLFRRCHFMMDLCNSGR